jgi:hypothetical protein
MNKKRQREIAYIKLNKKGTGYAIVAQPTHAESLSEHFGNKSVSFVKQGRGGAENLLEFPEGKDGEYLERILKEWKEKFVSGGEQYW